MATQLLSALVTIIVGVGGCLAYFYSSNFLLDRIFPAGASNDAAASSPRASASAKSH